MKKQDTGRQTACPSADLGQQSTQKQSIFKRFKLPKFEITTREITFLATIFALLAVFSIAFRFMPAAGAAVAPITLLIVVVGSIFGGWKGAIFSGFSMGILSLIANFINPGVLSPAFQNPLISVLPRLFVGVGVRGAYLLFGGGKRGDDDKVTRTIAATMAGIAAPIVNTGLVFLSMMAFFGLGFDFGGAHGSLQNWLMFLLATNFPIELGVVAVSAPLVCSALFVAFKSLGAKKSGTENKDESEELSVGEVNVKSEFVNENINENADGNTSEN
ncbi:MAG: hypothetical protein FWD86_03860 [Firmicutes bacterium]|nr:hypothetical protein [Bacillota bacterium]